MDVIFFLDLLIFLKKKPGWFLVKLRNILKPLDENVIQSLLHWPIGHTYCLATTFFFLFFNKFCLKIFETFFPILDLLLRCLDFFSIKDKTLFVNILTYIWLKTSLFIDVSSTLYGMKVEYQSLQISKKEFYFSFLARSLLYWRRLLRVWRHQWNESM